MPPKSCGDSAANAQPDDRELMRRLCKGDLSAFRELYQRYARRIGSYFYLSLGDKEAAEEGVQETFVRLWKAARTYQPRAKVSTFLYTIARNLIRTRLARTVKERFLSREQDAELLARVPSADLDQQPERAAEMEELRVRLSRALAALPHPEKEALILVQYQGLKYSQVAEILGIPEGTVKSRLNRAYGRLAKMLAELL